VKLDAFIAEDEPPARARLVATLARVAPGVTVVGHADSVKATRAWLAGHAPPDVLLLDIQLADGLSLELFDDGRLLLPTIFTTAYDRFAIDAFAALAVDYLLKPVGDAALATALHRLQRLGPGFGVEAAAWLQGRHGAAAPRRRERLVGRKGSAYHALPFERLAYVVSVDKLAFAVDAAGERYLLEAPLASLEAELDPQRFFRVNRQLLVAASAVQRFAAAGKGRLKVELVPPLPGDALVSQERATAFKAWLGGADPAATVQP
jgi:DNA-binding LytR/AlgR family response regulator